MAKSPLFGVGQQARSAFVTSQNRLNLYAEIQAAEDQTKIVFYGTAGLDAFCDVGPDPARGRAQHGDYVYAVHGDTVYRIGAAGDALSIGTIGTSTGLVDMAPGKDQILIVDGVTGYVIDVPTLTVSAVASASFPAGSTTCAWQDGYFIAHSGVNFYLSALDDAQTWPATDFAAAESTPEDIVRVASSGGQLYLFKSRAIEVWANNGSTDLPFSRVTGTAIEGGLAAVWSLAKFGGAFVFLGELQEGGVKAVIMRGFALEPISGQEVETIFNGYDLSDVTGLSYTYGGHSFYQINFPQEQISWAFDAATRLWHQLSSEGGVHRANIAANLGQQAIVADIGSGKWYRFNLDTYTEDGATIEREIRSRHLFGDDYFSISSLWLDIEDGVGVTTGQGDDPQAMLAVSKDGGRSWSSERWTSIGKIGEYKRRARWSRLGRSRNFTFKVRITDPVKVAICGEGWLR